MVPPRPARLAGLKKLAPPPARLTRLANGPAAPAVPVPKALGLLRGAGVNCAGAGSARAASTAPADIARVTVCMGVSPGTRIAGTDAVAAGPFRAKTVSAIIAYPSAVTG